MSVSYDVFTGAFLSKVTEYDLAGMLDFERNSVVDGYMKRAIAAFRSICKYDFSTTGDDIIREFDVDIDDGDLDEIADIVSEGMLVQWLKPYVYKQDGLENLLNTRDFTTFSPEKLVLRIRETHEMAGHRFTSMMREYSYIHNDLEDLHF